MVSDDGTGTNVLSLSGDDADSFQIVNDTELWLKAGVTLDYEAQDAYDVTVEVDDTTVGGTPDDTAEHTLTITDVNEAPVITSAATVSVSENNTLVMTVTATDPESPPQTIAFSITGGVDETLFEIDSAAVSWAF